MNKRDALRLKPGAIVLFFESSRIPTCGHVDPDVGVVKKVTERGGILLQVHRYHHPHNSYGITRWIPYSNVAQVRSKGKNNFDEVTAELNAGGSI